MTTKLDKPLRREVLIAREPWILTITPSGLKLTRKGRRRGLELDWNSLVNGDAALAAALNVAARLPPKRSTQNESVPRAKSMRARSPAARPSRR